MVSKRNELLGPFGPAGYILVAVLIGAVLGTLAVACAARTARKERLLQPERTAVDPVAPDDVSVHLDARE